MSLTMTTADAALKEDYQPAIREQINNAFKVLMQIERNSEDVEGRRAVLSLHVSRNAGAGARGEGGTLPTAGSQGYAEERVPLRYNYGSIKLSGPVIRAMKSDKGSFTRAIESESKGIVNDVKRDVNRQIMGTSNGVIAQCAVTSASTTVNLTSATAVQLRQLAEAMLIDIGTVASPTGVVSGRSITSVGTTSFVISGAAVTTAITDFVFRSGAGGDGSAQKELTGLQTIVDSAGTVFNVNPSTVPVWASTETASVGLISDLKFEQALHAVEIAGQSTVDLIITTDGVSRSYASSLQAQKRFANTQELKGGYKAITVQAGGGEVPLMWDRDCPSGIAFGLTTQHVKQHEMSDWEFMQEDNAVLSRVSGEDAYGATLFKYHEVTTDKRNAHFKMTGITET